MVQQLGAGQDPWLATDPYKGRGDGEGLVSVPPAALQLAQNYPNPFNPTTLIRYAIPVGTADVRLLVYDLAGMQVRTLVDGHCEPGWHEIVWDGRNDRGDRTASGVYFCRLDDGRSVSSKKVVLLK